MIATESEIQRVGRQLAAAASAPATVILFGSYARGENTKHSDLDFLVIEDELADKSAEARRLRAAVRDVEFPVDVVVSSRKEVDRKQHAVGSVIRYAVREGRVIHEPE